MDLNIVFFESRVSSRFVVHTPPIASDRGNGAFDVVFNAEPGQWTLHLGVQYPLSAVSSSSVPPSPSSAAARTAAGLASGFGAASSASLAPAAFAGLVTSAAITTAASATHPNQRIHALAPLHFGVRDAFSGTLLV